MDIFLNWNFTIPDNLRNHSRLYWLLPIHIRIYLVCRSCIPAMKYMLNSLLYHSYKYFLLCATNIKNMGCLQDEHLLRHIARNNILKPVIEAFIENGDRYNMLHSGVLELLEYVRRVIYLLVYFPNILF